MPTQLQQFRPTSINVDVPPAELEDNEFSGGFNVQFRVGFAHRSLGWGPLFPPLPDNQQPQFLINTQVGAVNYWLACCQESIYVTNTTSWFDITPASFVAPLDPSNWSGDLLNGIPILNNAAGPPVYWPLDTGQICLDLPDWPAAETCSQIGTSKFHIFAMGIFNATDTLPDQYKWSDAAAPGFVPGAAPGETGGWAPSPTGDAGDNILAATRSPILAGHNLRGQYLIFKSNSVYAQNYVGGSFVWSSRKLLSNSGILASKCVTSIPEGKAVLLSDGDIIVTDGQNVESIVDRRWKKEIFTRIDPNFYFRSFVVNDPANTEVLFCVPDKGNEYPNVAIVWDYSRDQIGIRDLPRQLVDSQQLGATAHIAQGVVTVATFDPSWDGRVGTWDEQVGSWNGSLFNPADDGLVIAVPVDGQLYYLDGETTENGADIIGNVSKTHMDMGDPYRVKLLRGIWPRVTVPSGTFMEVRAAGTMFTDETIVWGPWLPFNPNGAEKVDLFTQGRFLHIDIRSISGQDWILEGFDLDVKAAGYF